VGRLLGALGVLVAQVEHALDRRVLHVDDGAHLLHRDRVVVRVGGAAQHLEEHRAALRAGAPVLERPYQLLGEPLLLEGELDLGLPEPLGGTLMGGDGDAALALGLDQGDLGERDLALGLAQSGAGVREPDGDFGQALLGGADLGADVTELGGQARGLLAGLLEVTLDVGAGA
jgi:hypothetical protein